MKNHKIQIKHQIKNVWLYIIYFVKSFLAILFFHIIIGLLFMGIMVGYFSLGLGWLIFLLIVLGSLLFTLLFMGLTRTIRIIVGSIDSVPNKKIAKYIFIIIWLVLTVNRIIYIRSPVNDLDQPNILNIIHASFIIGGGFFMLFVPVLTQLDSSVK